MKPAVALLALASLSAACTLGDDGLPGTPLAKGLGRNLVVAPGGGAVAFLLDSAHPDDRAVPEDLVAGDLWLAALSSGAQAPARKVGAQVASVPGNVGFSPQGDVVAFLSAWRFRTGEGELWVARAGSEPKKLADMAGSFAWAPQGGALAYVSRGRLLALESPLADGGRTHAIEGMATFTWSPDGRLLAGRAPAGAGGRLVLLTLATGVQRDLGSSTDFAFAADGALAYLGTPGPKGGDRALSLLEVPAKAPRELGRATSFAFSADGQRLGLLSTARSPGDAFGELSVIGRSGGEPQVAGQKVSEWRFTSRGDAVVLSGYDLRSRAGTLVFAAAGGATKEISKRVRSFQVSPRGDRVLYVTHKVDKQDFKLELWAEPLPVPGALLEEPRKLDEGVYGFQIAPDGLHLFWKSRCASLRSCSLYRARLDQKAPAELVAKDIAGFDLSDDGQRLLLAHPHRRANRAVDLSVVSALEAAKSPPLKPFALEVEPGARFADGAGRRVVAARLSANDPKVVSIELP